MNFFGLGRRNRRDNRTPGACGGIPQKDGRGEGRGARGTPRQPPKRSK